MKKQLYPAVLERGPKGAFGAWFPDFPGCVAGGRSHEQTIERAENVLAQAVDRMFEHGRPLPELGMSRSSFFGLAASTALTYFPVNAMLRPGLAEPRSKVQKRGGLRTKTSPAKKSPV